MTDEHPRAFAATGGGDWMARAASTVPVEVIATAIGLAPASARQVRELAEIAWERFKEDPEALGPMAGMLTEELDARRIAPRDDFLTYVLSETVQGRRISEQEIMGLLIGLVVAGHETTMNASGNLALVMARDPDQQARMRADATLREHAVEESLRFDSPVQGFFRALTRDVVIDGVELAEGDRVLLLYGSANRDPERFADPDMFAPDRKDVSKHYSFGLGTHRCVGAYLAQIELRILAELLGAYQLELSAEPVFRAPSGGGTFAGIKQLELVISAA